MKKIILLLVAVLAIQCNAPAQEKTTITQQRPTQLVGVKEKADLQQAPFSSWFNAYYQYKYDDATVAAIKNNLDGVTVKCFMGTWCADSKRETPRFYKIMEDAGFDDKNLELITVNSSKKTPDNLQAGFDIIKVPTFIFYKNGKEIGRFVERPRESLEKDILKIVSGQPYKHYYDRS